MIILGLFSAATAVKITFFNFFGDYRILVKLNYSISFK